MIQYQPDAVHQANVSPTLIVQAMLRVKMPVAQTHVRIRVSVAKMHCALLEAIRLCASVLVMLKAIHITNVSLLNVPIIRTVTYRNLASIQNVLIRVLCPTLVDRMQTAMWKIISVFVRVIQEQQVSNFIFNFFPLKSNFKYNFYESLN